MWLLNNPRNPEGGGKDRPEVRQWMQNEPLVTEETEILRVRVTECLALRHHW